MTTVRQAVERQIESGAIDREAPVSLRTLHGQFHPTPSGSTRALLLSMSARVASRLPWAIILCRFKDAEPDPDVENPIEHFYREVFKPGTGGLIEYWRDVSLGAIDITGSKVFGWVTVGIKRSEAGGSSKTDPTGPGRSGLNDYAVKAVQASGDDPLKGFHSQIAVYTENWSKDGVDQTGEWKAWAPYWIDGSTDGRGKVTLPPPHNGDVIAHEMGHGLGIDHDVSADFQTHYADPCCIMSQQTPFFHPTWGRNFGPALCLPHLIQRGWMFNRRVFRDTGAWLRIPDGITVRLAPVTDPGAPASLGLRLGYKSGGNKWEYFLEYVKPEGWNQGLNRPFVFVRRIGPGKDIGPTPAILGQIPVPGVIGQSSEFLEFSGRVKFRVELVDAAGRVVHVTAARQRLIDVIWKPGPRL